MHEFMKPMVEQHGKDVETIYNFLLASKYRNTPTKRQVERILRDWF